MTPPHQEIYLRPVERPTINSVIHTQHKDSTLSACFTWVHLDLGIKTQNSPLHGIHTVIKHVSQAGRQRYVAAWCQTQV